MSFMNRNMIHNRFRSPHPSSLADASFFSNTASQVSSSVNNNNNNVGYINTLHASMFASGSQTRHQEQYPLYGIRSNGSFSWTDPRVLAWIYSSLIIVFYVAIMSIILCSNLHRFSGSNSHHPLDQQNQKQQQVIRDQTRNKGSLFSWRNHMSWRESNGIHHL